MVVSVGLRGFGSRFTWLRVYIHSSFDLGFIIVCQFICQTTLIESGRVKNSGSCCFDTRRLYCVTRITG